MRRSAGAGQKQGHDAKKQSQGAFREVEEFRKFLARGGYYSARSLSPAQAMVKLRERHVRQLLGPKRVDEITKACKLLGA